MTAPDAAEKLAKIKAIVDAWNTDDVPNDRFRLCDIADILDEEAPAAERADIAAVEASRDRLALESWERGKEIERLNEEVLRLRGATPSIASEGK